MTETVDAKPIVRASQIDERGVVIQDSQQLAQLAAMVVSSEMCPKQYRGRPKDAMIAILAGRQVGFGAIQSLAMIAVVNGRPSMYGEGPSSLAYGSGKVEWIREWWEQDGHEVEEPNFAQLEQYPDNLTACWQTKRKDADKPSSVARFSVSDAKVAHLWNKRGRDGGPTPWISYPKRMLVFRARSWGLRDNYGDALQGISQAEEWADMKDERPPDPLETATALPALPAPEAPQEAQAAPGEAIPAQADPKPDPADESTWPRDPETDNPIPPAFWAKEEQA